MADLVQPYDGTRLIPAGVRAAAAAKDRGRGDQGERHGIDGSASFPRTQRLHAALLPLSHCKTHTARAQRTFFGAFRNVESSRLLPRAMPWN